MCEKCSEIDATIAHYRGLARQITDRQALDATARVTRNLEAQKVALHPKK